MSNILNALPTLIESESGNSGANITFDDLKENAGYTTTTTFSGNTITETIKAGATTVATRTTTMSSNTITENFIYYEEGAIKINNTKVTTIGTDITEVVTGAV